MKRVSLQKIFFDVLAENLLLSSKSIYDQMQMVPLTKQSVKKEIYRRLLVAKEFINANLENKIDLSQIAREAGISDFHFHRLFKKTFNITPIQLLIRRRMLRAKCVLQ